MKIARVNLEACVWGDGRFPHLERLLGYPPCRGHLAIARMAIIWGWQVEHYTPDAPCFHVPEDVIEMALEVDGRVAIAALVRARLAEETPDGVRMKGSSHEATGWLWRIRQRSAAAVDAKKQKASEKRKSADVTQPMVDPGFTAGEPRLNPLSSEISDLPDLSLSGRAHDLGAPAPVAVGTVPALPPVVPFAPVLRLVELAVELLNIARLEIDPGAQPVHADMGDERAAADHLRPLPEAEREPAIRRGVANLAERVRLGLATIGDLRPGELFGPRAWRKYQADTVESLRKSTRGRDGPGSRSPPRGQAPIATVHRIGPIPLDED